MWKITFQVKNATVHTDTNESGWCSDAEGDEFSFMVDFIITNEEKNEWDEQDIKIPKCLSQSGSGYCNSRGGVAKVVKVKQVDNYDGRYIQDTTIAKLFDEPFTRITRLVYGSEDN